MRIVTFRPINPYQFTQEWTQPVAIYGPNADGSTEFEVDSLLQASLLAAITAHVANPAIVAPQPITPEPVAATPVVANASTANQAIGNGDTYLTGSNVSIGGRIKAGTFLKWEGTVSKAAVAGTTAPQFHIRFGTAGTIADTARVSFTSTVQSNAADTGRFEIEAVIRSVGAAATVQGTLKFEHINTTTGLINVAQVRIYQVLSAAFDNTAANLIAGLSINPGLAWTVHQVTAQGRNLA